MSTHPHNNQDSQHSLDQPPTMDKHNDAVQKISDRMQDFYSRKEQYRIFHGSTNSTRNYTIDRTKMIDTSQLNHVLSVDTTTQTALVEPNVPMDSLVAAILPYGLVPPVVMEFPGITVGGGYAGTSGESSSFKHGFFDATINWAEIVLPNGEIVKASDTEHTDLFHGAAGSFGTLGVATLFELQLVPAKKYVELTYHAVDTMHATFELLDKAAKDFSNDYVDGIVMSKGKGIIMTGKLTDTVSSDIKIQTFRRARDPWFYIHADRITRGSSSNPIREAIPLEDYLFRYDRGAFWTGAYAYKYFMTPFNRITRWALDDFMKTRVMYHALHESGHAKQYMIQDLALPSDNVEEFVEYVDQTFGFYPLWLCPLRPADQGRNMSMHPRSNLSESSTSSSSSSTAGQLVNVGVWGPGPTNYTSFISINRNLENKVRQLGGMKWLYAQAFYTESEFWDIYGKKWYDDLRSKYHASHLQNVYEKVTVDLSGVKDRRDMSMREWVRDLFWATWPMTGVYGVLKTLVGKDYLLSK